MEETIQFRADESLLFFLSTYSERNLNVGTSVP